jgi:hypothetical protein
MIQQTHLVEDLNKSQMRASRPDYFRNLRLFEALFREARALGALPLKDPLEGIENDIRLARVLNVRTTS